MQATNRLVPAAGTLLALVATALPLGAVAAPGPSTVAGALVSVLTGVSALSSTDAWAVGYQNADTEAKALIEHWDGSAWTKVASPAPGRISELAGVSAVSASDVWAVGDWYHESSGGQYTLIEHWDGTSWTQVKAPSPGGHRGGTYPVAISASSPTDAWVTGFYPGGPLFLHWDGTRWSLVTKTGLGGRFAEMLGVAAISPTDAWAVGQYNNASSTKFLTMHWDGTTWNVVPSAKPAGAVAFPSLSSVSAVSANDVWAAGGYFVGNTLKGFIQRWDGKSWTELAHPNPGGDDTTEFNAISASSTGNAWAAGYLLRPRVPLTERWDGQHWKNVSIPGAGLLLGVSADSDSDAWAVGYDGKDVLLAHWDGTHWTRFSSRRTGQVGPAATGGSRR